MGGKDSKLVHDLAKLGVTPDDIAVVSKHDTSTNANDPNESELHNTLAHAIGRTDGNPLFVISQKTLTGHAKVVLHLPGQRSDPAVQVRRDSGERGARCVDPKLQRDDHMVWVRKPLRIGGGEDEFGRETAGRPVKAGLATSLGFGHVSGFVAWFIRVPSRRPWPRPMVRPHWKLGVSVPTPAWPPASVTLRKA